MRRTALAFALFLAGIFCLAQQEHVSAYWQSRDSNYNIKISGGGSPPSLDGSAVNNASATSVSATLTTSHSNDTIVGCALTTGQFVSIADTSSLSWTTKVRGDLTSFYLWEFWAPAASPLASDVITITAGSSGFMALNTFGVSGTNASPFDPNGSLPVVNGSGNITGLSTTNSNTFVLGCFRSSSNGPYTPTPGYTAISNIAGTFLMTEYQTFTSPQTSLTIAVPAGLTSSGGIGDALTQ